MSSFSQAGHTTFVLGMSIIIIIIIIIIILIITYLGFMGCIGTTNGTQIHISHKITHYTKLKKQ
jgi:hypothetical protein